MTIIKTGPAFRKQLTTELKIKVAIGEKLTLKFELASRQGTPKHTNYLNRFCECPPSNENRTLILKLGWP